MYLTYEEYLEMGGTLSAPDFEDIAYEAESYINWYTFNRLAAFDEIPFEVKQCEYYIIKLVLLKMNSMGVPRSVTTATNNGVAGQIMSQSNDGVSISYNILAARDAIASLSNEIQSAIQRHMRGIVNNLGRNLLYRGLYPGE